MSADEMEYGMSDEEGLGSDNSDYDDSDFDCASDDDILDRASGDVGASFMTEAELDVLMDESISKVSEITGLAEDPARALLDHLRWKVEDTITLALDDLPGIAKKAGLMLDAAGSANLLAKCPDTECEICMEEGPALALPCGHAACSDCWTSYVESEVESTNHSISCVGAGCHTALLTGQSDRRSRCDPQAVHDGASVPGLTRGNIFLLGDGSHRLCRRDDRDNRLHQRTHTRPGQEALHRPEMFTRSEHGVECRV